MRVIWSDKAISDLGRLRRFLVSVNPRAAKQVVMTLRQAPVRLAEHPRLGVRHEALAPDEVRRLIVGSYEIRYQVEPESISILRVFHAKEDRN